MTHACGEIEYGLRMMCGKPTPVKRFITVLIVGEILTAVNIYFVASSIYNMGVHDAKKQFLEVRHIETLKLPKTENDSIKSIKNYELKIKSNEYKQSNR
ncbi:MAG: TraL conjugative transposon family protein [Dysgonamonadaceae bacterium]|nr:TraL conjugative transposon family protein [Dysgonamonadaceae bacterium]